MSSCRHLLWARWRRCLSSWRFPRFRWVNVNFQCFSDWFRLKEEEEVIKDTRLQKEALKGLAHQLTIPATLYEWKGLQLKGFVIHIQSTAEPTLIPIKLLVDQFQRRLIPATPFPCCRVLNIVIKWWDVKSTTLRETCLWNVSSNTVRQFHVLLPLAPWNTKI